VRERMSAARKKALADPAVRERMSAARKKALADPAVRERISKALGWLQPDEVRQVLEEIRAGRRYADIAADWLVTEGTISRLACKHGIERRPRKAAAVAAAPCRSATA